MSVESWSGVRRSGECSGFRKRGSRRKAATTAAPRITMIDKEEDFRAIGKARGFVFPLFSFGPVVGVPRDRRRIPIRDMDVERRERTGR